MMEISTKLEPAIYEAKTILFDELDEFTEIIFPMKGIHLVGYSINKKQVFIQKHKRNVIGAYAVTFGKRALFIYKTLTQITGYFIRRTNWMQIINNDEFSDLIKQFKDNIRKGYENKVKMPIFEAKKKKIESVANRNDYE